MKPESLVKIIFTSPQGLKREITITLKDLLDKTTEDLYDILEGMAVCKNSGCNNESQNFCDCDSEFQDYEISDVLEII
jgi:hypothetical protein